MRSLPAAALLVLAGLAQAQPPEARPRWEYAELSYRSSLVATKEEGRPTPTLAVRWTTGKNEVHAKSWDELADKLKLAGLDKQATPGVQKMQVLDGLGVNGWELLSNPASSLPPPTRVEFPSFGSAVMLFKRRVQ